MQCCQRIKHLIQACQPISLSRYFSTRNSRKRKFRQNYTVVVPYLVNSWYLPMNGVTRGSRPVFVSLPSFAPTGSQKWQDCLSALRETRQILFCIYKFYCTNDYTFVTQVSDCWCLILRWYEVAQSARRANSLANIPTLISQSRVD